MKKKYHFDHARFAASVFSKEQFPSLTSSEGAALPEIAIFGKSNVGKSSLINNLLRNPKLAKTSSTPGKTQSLNFYIIDDQLVLVDLPGYGFASVNTPLKEQWAATLEFYLKQHNHLKLVLILLDARRVPSEEDLELIRWAVQDKHPLLLLFTKADKLGAREKHAHQTTALPLIQRCAPTTTIPSLYYSIKDPKSRTGLITTLNVLLKEI